MTAKPAESVQPKLTAEQGLTRLLELIRTSKSVHEFTPQYLSLKMGVEVESARDGSGSYGFGETVTPQWVHGFEVDMHAPGPRLDFSFDPVVPGTSPDMTGLCQVDFDKFTAELEAMGFSRTHNFDSPPQPTIGDTGEERRGRLMYDRFDRPGMVVHVYPRGEANEPVEKITHDCVQMVLIY